MAAVPRDRADAAYRGKCQGEDEGARRENHENLQPDRLDSDLSTLPGARLGLAGGCTNSDLLMVSQMP